MHKVLVVDLRMQRVSPVRLVYTSRVQAKIRVFFAKLASFRHFRLVCRARTVRRESSRQKSWFAVRARTAQVAPSSLKLGSRRVFFASRENTRLRPVRCPASVVLLEPSATRLDRPTHRAPARTARPQSSRARQARPLALAALQGNTASVQSGTRT